jgi:hypothetical protein
MSVQSFRGLHQGPAVLVLPNAWDAGTARLIESIGAKAIATTSAGARLVARLSGWQRAPDRSTRDVPRVPDERLDRMAIL